MGGLGSAAPTYTRAGRGVSGGPQGAKRGEEGGAREEHFVVTNASQNAIETLVFVPRKRPPPPIGRHKEKPPAHARGHTHTHTKVRRGQTSGREQPLDPFSSVPPSRASSPPTESPIVFPQNLKQSCWV